MSIGIYSLSHSRITEKYVRMDIWCSVFGNLKNSSLIFHCQKPFQNFHHLQWHHLGFFECHFSLFKIKGPNLHTVFKVWLNHRLIQLFSVFILFFIPSLIIHYSGFVINGPHWMLRWCNLRDIFPANSR